MSSSDFTQAAPGPPLIGARLRMAWEVVQRRMLEALRSAGFDDLDAPHLRLLQYPGPQGLRPSELAARLGMSKQAVNYMLGELEARGYLARRPDPDDARLRRIELTARGETVGRTMRAAVAEVEREWAERVGAERFAQLEETLRELARPAQGGS